MYVNSTQKKPQVAIKLTEITPSDESILYKIMMDSQESFKLQVAQYGIKALPYIPWIFLPPTAIEQCLSISSDPIKGKEGEQTCILYPYIWDHEKFNSHPASKYCPPVELERPKILSTNTTWLSCTFGYRPYVSVDPKTKAEKVSNTLRFDMERFLPEFKDEFQVYRTYLLLQTEALMMKAYNARHSLGSTFKSITRKGLKAREEDEPTTVQHVNSHFKPLLKPAKGTYNDYTQFKLMTYQGDDALGIAPDPFTAYLKVYKNKDGTLVVDRLTKENSTALSIADPNIQVNHILKARMWSKVNHTYDHMNITEADFGVTRTAKAVRVAEDDEFEGSTDPSICYF